MSKRKLNSETQALAKKRKLNVKTDSVLSPFEKLPEHLIINIINNLKCRDILNVFLINKNLNRIISNSTRIMKRFELTWSDTEPFKKGNKKNFHCIRKYSSLKLNALSGKFMKPTINFLQPYVKHIKNLQITSNRYSRIGCMVTREFILKILALFDQIETLNISGFSYFNDDQEFNERKWKNTKPIELPCELPNLKNLTFADNGYGLVNLFVNCKLSSFKIVSDPDGSATNKDFAPFLKLQPCIENLDLSSCDQELFKDDASEQMNMKLKSLSVKSTGELLNENFKKFVKNQADSLQDLFIKDYIVEECLEIIAICKNVKNLKLLNFYDNNDVGDFNPPIKSVKEMTLVNFYNIQEYISKSFPNLRVLNLDECEIQEDILKDMHHIIT